MTGQGPYHREAACAKSAPDAPGGTIAASGQQG